MLPHLSAFMADGWAVCCVGISHARSSLAAGTSRSDRIRRHKGIPYIKYSVGGKEEKLFTYAAGIRIKIQRFFFHTTVETILPHIKLLIIRTE